MMDLVQWAPFVRQSKRPGEHAAMFEIKAWLSCLFCGATTEVTSPSTPLSHYKVQVPGGDTKLAHVGDTGFMSTPESRTHAAVEYFRSNKTCEHCGTISAMPPKHLAALKAGVLRVVTLEWIKQQEENLLPVEPYLRTELEALVKGTAQKLLNDMKLDQVLAERVMKVDILPVVKEQMRTVIKPLIQVAVREAIADELDLIRRA